MKNLLFFLLFQFLFLHGSAQWSMPGSGQVNKDLNSGSVIITDNGGASDYTPGADGRLVITPHPDSVIKLSFEEFHLGAGADLYLFEFPYIYQSPYVKLFGNKLPGNYYSRYPGKRLELNFNTSSYYPSAPGFKIKAELLSLSQVPPADPSLKDLMIKSESIASGGSVKIQLSCANNGGKSDPVMLGFYLSSDTILSSSDTRTGTFIGDTILCLTEKPIEAWSDISTSISEGWYYLLVKADPDNMIPEVNEGDNLVWKKIYVKEGFCDLSSSTVFTSYSQQYYTQTVTHGILFPLYVTLRNVGINHFYKAVAECYFSNDFYLDSSDVLLGALELNDLRPDMVNNGVLEDLQVPPGILAGNRYVIVKTDPGNLISEWNESNNITAFKVIVKQSMLDYEMYTQYGVSFLSIFKGRSDQLTYSLRTPFGSAQTIVNNAVYFSADEAYDSTDVLLHQKSDTVQGYYNNSSFQLSFPSSFTADKGWLHFVADHDQAHTEKDESNNVVSLQVALLDSALSDLTFREQYSIFELYPGQNLNFSFYYRNDGDYPSPFSYGRVLLSADSIPDNADLVLKDSVDLSTLFPGNESSSYIYSKLPDSISPGKYVLLYQIDPSNSVNEQDEGNNIGYSPITILADQMDLEATSISAYDTLRFGVGNYIYGNLKSHSNSVLKNISSTLFLSNDPILDQNDLVLYSEVLDSLEKFSGYGTYYYDTIQNLSAGTHYLIFKVDVSDSIQETDETNNMIVRRIFIGSSSDLPSVIIPASGSAQINKCDLRIYDSGGATYNYGNNNNGLLTVIPETGKFIQLNTKYLSCSDAGDKLAVFDGPNSSSGLIGNFFFTPSVISASSTSGALTLSFKSDDAGNREGLSIVTSCVSDELPDLVHQKLECPSVTFAGSSISLNGFFENCSDRFVQESIWAVYLSSDPVFDAGDKQVFAKLLPPARQFARMSNNAWFRLSDSVSAGRYYIISVLDQPGLIDEKSESNNILTKEFDVIVPATDFWIYRLISSSLPDKGMRVELAMGNYYGQQTDSVLTELFLSADQIPDSNDRVLMRRYTSNGFYQTLSFDSTDLMLSGNLFLIARVDGNELIAEESELNNDRVVPVFINSLKADLVISAGISSSIGEMIPSNYSVEFKYRVRNAGFKSTGAYRVGVYLSQDSLYNAGDYLVEQTTNQYGIYSGQSIEENAFHYFGSLSPPGQYYLLVRVDELNAISESNENNNVAFLKVRVVPERHDFKLLNPFVGRRLASPGQYFDYYCSGYDKEPFQNGGFHVRSYLSRDSILDTLDVVNGNWTVGNSQQMQAAFMLPADTGLFYLILKADPDDQYLEVDESDNTVFVSFYVTDRSSDIYFSAADLKQDTLAPGGSPVLSYTVRSITSYGYDTTSLYLSSDQVWDLSDIALGSSVRYFWGNSSYYWEKTFDPIPSSVGQGSYYLILKADAPDAYLEINELNNLVVFPINIAPVSQNISVRSLITSWDSIVAGQYIQLYFSMINTGNTNQTDSCWFYLSTDTIWDSADILMYKVPYSIAPSIRFDSYLGLPNTGNLPAGDYYIILVADRDNLVGETDESDNTAFVRMKIRSPYIDLSGASSGIWPAAVSGYQQYYYTLNVKNSGNIHSGYGSCDLWLSSDSILSSDDVFMDEADLYSISPGYQNAVSFQFQVSGLPGKYLISRIDITDTINETNELNNTWKEKFSATFSQADLVSYINLWSGLDTVLVDEAYSFEFRVSNSGRDSAASSLAGIYLSDDHYLQVNDNILGTAELPAMRMYQGFDVDTNIVVPAMVQTGWKKLFIAADFDNALEETDEGNNLGYTYVFVQNPNVIKDVKTKKVLMIYPNPSFDRVHISGIPDDVINVEVYTVQGKKVLEQAASKSELYSLEVSDLAPGSYIIRINCKNQPVTGRFVKM